MDTRITDVSVRDFRANADVNKPVIDAITSGLDAYNASTRPDPSARPVTLAVRNEADDVVAGLLGRIAYGWLRIDAVWVSDQLRGNGVGSELIRRAERIALETGCRGVHLDTHDFQAPGLYERLGYRCFGQLEHYPDQDVHSYFMKRLR